MVQNKQACPQRYIGLDIHKHYLIAAGVNRDQEPVYDPLRVPYGRLQRWIERDLTAQDAIVLEMTTNTWKLVDLLEGCVHSVTVVHPPHVHLITRAQVMTDKKAALTLAKLHAANLLPPVWVPPPEVRDLRALIAQRTKMVRLATQAKNRLQAVLHRHHLQPPEQPPYHPEKRGWWEALPVSPLERFRLQSDLDTIAFSQQQIHRLKRCLAQQMAQDPRLPLLVQIPGVAFNNAATILAAIGDIHRFPSAAELVGYAGLGARVHDSGQSHWTGRITKRGRREGPAPCYGRSSPRRRPNPSSLAGRIEAADRPDGAEEGYCGHCSQAAGDGLARVEQRMCGSLCYS